MDSQGPLCTRCGVRPADAGQRRCSKCRDANKRQKAIRRQRLQQQFGKSRLDELATLTEDCGGYEAESTHIGAANTQPRYVASMQPVVRPSNGALDSANVGAVRVQDKVRDQDSRSVDSGLVAILADQHIPEDDKPACAAVFAWLAQTQPSVIVLAGDVGEFESCSAHGTSPDAPTFKADLAAVTEWLSRLRRTVPGARIAYLEGNHETRAERLRCALVPRLAGHRGLWQDLDLPSLGIEWWPQDKVFSIGTIDVVHGHQLGERPGKFCASRLSEVYGVVGRTAIMGHAHRRQLVERSHVMGNAVGVSVGCLRTLHPSWLKGTEYGWVHGFAVANVQQGRRTSVECIEINDGAFWWGGRRYAG